PSMTLDLAPASGRRPGRAAAPQHGGSVEVCGPDPVPALRLAAALSALGSALGGRQHGGTALTPIPATEVLSAAGNGPADRVTTAALLALCGLAADPDAASAEAPGASFALSSDSEIGPVLMVTADRRAAAPVPRTAEAALSLAQAAMAPGTAEGPAVEALATAIAALSCVWAGTNGRLTAARLGPILLDQPVPRIAAAAFTLGPGRDVAGAPTSPPETD
ncbi:MAG: hypothetical protein AAF698_08335, partial [Pseudomonadota bacterium]